MPVEDRAGNYFLTVSLIVAVNVPTAVLGMNGAPDWRSSHLPLLNLVRSPETLSAALPVPGAPANLPVLLAPSTVKGNVSVITARQVWVDKRVPVGTPVASKMMARSPAEVLNVNDSPFVATLLSTVLDVVATGPVNTRWNVELVVTAGPVSLP